MIENGGEKSKRHCSLSEIMKYVIAFLIAVYVIILFVHSSGSNKSFAEVERPIKESVNFEEMKDVGGQGLKRYYGLNKADYEGALLYISNFNLSAEEVLMIKVKDEEQVQTVVDAIDKRLENRKNDFEGYAPNEVKLLDEAQKSVRGKFIFLSVGKQAEHYKKIFSDSL